MKMGENIYQRKDGRYEGRYKKGRKSDGKIQYGYVYGRTKAEVRLKLYPLKEKYLYIQENYGDTLLTIGEWGRLWLKDVKENVTPATFENYNSRLNKHVFTIIGAIPLTEFSQPQAEAFLDQLLETLSPGTVRVIQQLLKTCFDAAITGHLLSRNPFRHIRLTNFMPKKIQSLQKSQSKKFIEAALQEDIATGLPSLLALFMGLKPEEIFDLQWQDINFTADYMSIRPATMKQDAPEVSRKIFMIRQAAKQSAAVRMVPFGKKIRSLLLALQEDSQSPYVFTRGDQPYDIRSLNHDFHTISHKAGLTELYFHQLRHTFVIHCLEQGADVPSISVLLGHANTQITLAIYSQTVMAQRMKLIAALEQ